METKSTYEPEFAPVPLARNRHDGWSPQRQKQFLVVLSATGTVGRAAQAVGMSKMSAYKLRKRTGAESFVAAWDDALSAGRAHMLDCAMERAINGVTTIRLRLGGVIDLDNGIDRRMMMDALRVPPQRNGAR